jgi:hypothetical protein
LTKKQQKSLQHHLCVEREHIDRCPSTYQRGGLDSQKKLNRPAERLQLEYVGDLHIAFAMCEEYPSPQLPMPTRSSQSSQRHCPETLRQTDSERLVVKVLP